MNILQFDSLWILVHMYHLISMQYPVIQSVITGFKCFIVKHMHTHKYIWMGTHMHTRTHGFGGFFSLACV